MPEDPELGRIMQEKMERIMRERRDEREAELAEHKIKPIAVTDSNFDSTVLDSELPVLVDFSAGWCMPCKVMEPIIEDMASKYGSRMVFAKLNVDENPLIPARYEVLGIPTLILFQGGIERERIVGVVSLKRLEQILIPYIT